MTASVFHPTVHTVEGDVRKSGSIPITGGMTLLRAIAEAQGLSDNASTTVLLFRQENGRRLAGRLDVLISVTEVRKIPICRLAT